jgi:hypothetical protein
MKVMLNLPCELEEVPAKLFLLASSDWDNLSRLAGEELYNVDSQYVQPIELLKMFERIRGLLVDFDQKLEVATNLLKEQQAAVLGISVPEEQDTEEQLEKLQQVLVNYDSGVGLPTGSE